MNKQVIFRVYFFIILILSGTACTKYNRLLLKKNIVVTDSDKISKAELSKFIRQKPNKKLVYVFPFNLLVYNLAVRLPDRTSHKQEKIERKVSKIQDDKSKALNYDKMNKKKQRTFKSWLMNTIGEAPVLVDSSLIKSTTNQMLLFCKTNGFFYPAVAFQIEKSGLRKNKAVVTYTIHEGQQYSIRNVDWVIPDPSMKSVLSQTIEASSLISGIPYSEDVMDSERDIITSKLRNSGYYYFSKSYIVFEADTTVGNRMVDVKLIIKPYLELISKEEKIYKETSHPVCLIHKIYFYTDFNLLKLKDAKNDTLEILYSNRFNKQLQTYYFIHSEPFQVKPSVLLDKLYLKKNDQFNAKNAISTYNSISGLLNFRNINLQFQDVGTDSSGYRLLNAHIQLTPLDRQSFSTEIEATNSAGNLGVSGYISYKNRSIFRGAEILTLRVKGAVEAQKTLIESKIKNKEDNVIQGIPFNTLETGFESQLTFPRFLLPKSSMLFTERNAAKTGIIFGIFYQQRPDYTRYISNISLSYNWNETETKHVELSPFLNLVRISPDSAFAARIEQLSKPLQTSYKDHLINGLRFSYVIANQAVSKKNNYDYFKGNIESAGFLNRQSSIWFAGAKPDQTYRIFGIRFAQYIKGDADYRKYFSLGKDKVLATRLFVGVGVPWGNIDVMPFDKRYSIGGANDIRAWKFRSLGPGSYTDSTLYDKTGDIAFIGNIEYRFPLIGILQSALFIDAGNIWTLKKYNDFPGGEFTFSEFYKTIALGTGIGLRLNFGFFLLRFDFGLPLYDPGMSSENRWLSFRESRGRTNLNFGIGYPF